MNNINIYIIINMFNIIFGIFLLKQLCEYFDKHIVISFQPFAISYS